MKKILFIIILIVLSSQMAFATNYYVRPDAYASGSNNGADWTNAFRGMPVYDNAFWTTTLQAGDTVFVAGGTYTTLWNINKGGTSEAARITIKRATVADHGTDTGWEVGLDTTATLSGVGIQLYSSSGGGYVGPDYVTIDGNAAYGIKVDLTGIGGHGVLTSVNNRGRSNYITLKNLEIVGYGKGCDVANEGIHDTPTVNSGGNEHYGLKIQNCKIYNVCGAAIAIQYSHNAIIENNYIYDIGGAPGVTHEDFIIVYYSNAGIIRNNIFRDTYALGILLAQTNLMTGGIAYNWAVYNNIFYQTSSPISGQVALKFIKRDAIYRNAKVYNNTFHNWYMPINVAGDTGNHTVDIQNNIFYASQYANVYDGTGVTNDYNAYLSSGTTWDEAHDQTDSTATDPFTDSDNGDFTISATWDAAQVSAEKASLIGKGTTLASPFDVDKAGVTRTAPFDIGAYDVGGEADTTAPVTSLKTPVTTPSSNQAASCVITVGEAGTVTYGGTCGNGSLSTAVVGDNTVQWNLAVGTYSNCTITVTDAASNASTPLAITSFTITPEVADAVKNISGGVSFQRIP